MTFSKNDIFQKRPVGCLLVVGCFWADHTATLVALIHLCSGDLPATCYIYDKLVAAMEEWCSILEFRADRAHPELTEFSPRLECALQQSANSDGFQRLLREAVKHLHTALVNCMEKEAHQVQFFNSFAFFGRLLIAKAAYHSCGSRGMAGICGDRI